MGDPYKRIKKIKGRRFFVESHSEPGGGKLVRSFSVRDLSKRIVSVGPFLVGVVLYTGFASVYFFLVLRFLDGRTRQVFVYSKPLYALVALTLMSAQGFALELNGSRSRHCM